MTEERICEILAKQNHNLPKLNRENVEKISKSLTEIIYDSFKLKLPSATEKRLTVLKYLRSLNCNSDSHLSINQSNYEIFLKSIQKIYKNTEDNSSFQHFLEKIQLELKASNLDNLHNEISKFTARKTLANQVKAQKLESIRNFDQESLNVHSAFTHKINKPYFFSETHSEFLELLFEDNASAATTRLKVTESLQFRHVQVKYAYALLYSRKWDYFRAILRQWLEYEGFSPEEKEFLVYLTCHLDLELDKGKELAGMILEEFGFVFELILIRICTEMVQGGESSKGEVLRRFCHFDSGLRFKLKGMIFELYCWSFCNEQILGLLDQLS